MVCQTKWDYMNKNRGIPYSVREAMLVLDNYNGDIYHKDLMIWLCGRVKILDAYEAQWAIEDAKKNNRKPIDRDYWGRARI